MLEGVTASLQIDKTPFVVKGNLTAEDGGGRPYGSPQPNHHAAFRSNDFNRPPTQDFTSI